MENRTVSLCVSTQVKSVSQPHEDTPIKLNLLLQGVREASTVQFKSDRRSFRVVWIHVRNKNSMEDKLRSDVLR